MPLKINNIPTANIPGIVYWSST